MGQGLSGAAKQGPAFLGRRFYVNNSQIKVFMASQTCRTTDARMGYLRSAALEPAGFMLGSLKEGHARHVPGCRLFVDVGKASAPDGTEA